MAGEQMKDCARQLYELFMSLTSQGKYHLPWNELPDAWQQAWVEVFKKAKSMELPSE